MTILDKIQKRLRKTLANDVCSAQALDESADRARVLKEIMKELGRIQLDHANLNNAFNSELNADQIARI